MKNRKKRKKQSFLPKKCLNTPENFSPAAQKRGVPCLAQYYWPQIIKKNLPWVPWVPWLPWLLGSSWIPFEKKHLGGAGISQGEQGAPMSLPEDPGTSNERPLVLTPLALQSTLGLPLGAPQGPHKKTLGRPKPKKKTKKTKKS